MTAGARAGGGAGGGREEKPKTVAGTTEQKEYSPGEGSRIRLQGVEARVGGAYQRTADAGEGSGCNTSRDVRRRLLARACRPSAIGSKRTGGSPNASHRGSRWWFTQDLHDTNTAFSVGIIIISSSRRVGIRQHAERRRKQQDTKLE